ncbi:uncharacterized protein LOC125379143 [Haliotis rufescens]|uniref:uncharacterized protein LOC125379143 n=1 Tax=Haliotis rufescens TaxID=6454 RepID=UPI00201F7ECB|nr:uncharacterized protein LOC125379143 [Haliotis rufescens]
MEAGRLFANMTVMILMMILAMIGVFPELSRKLTKRNQNRQDIPHLSCLDRQRLSRRLQLGAGLIQRDHLKDVLFARDLETARVLRAENSATGDETARMSTQQSRRHVDREARPQSQSKQGVGGLAARQMSSQ